VGTYLCATGWRLASAAQPSGCSMLRVAALFVDPRGVYAGLPDVEVWDEARDARLYAGPWPVVAHPPCARWSLLAGLVEHRYGIKRYEDGGCFRSALDSVRRWGGVLEHPAFSHAWWFHELPRPPASGGWVRGIDGGWAAHVEQGAYGHRAPKATWLYAFGVTDLPLLRWGPSGALARMNTLWESRAQHRARLTRVEFMDSKGERSATPVAFRDLLLAMARSVHQEAACAL